jgi:lipopolysaccharide exporter
MSDGEGMGSRIARGAAWLIGMRMSIRGLGLVSTVVLARLLAPADFGLIAMAVAVWSTLEVVLDVNFSYALITDSSSDRSIYSTAWTWSILKGFVVGLLLFVAAPWVAAYFHDVRLVEIVRAYGAVSVLSGFQNIGIIDFVKDLKFHKNFAMGTGAKLVSFAATMTAAVLLRNYWALVIGVIVQTSATVVLSFVLSDFRPRLGFKRSVGLLSFSSWQMMGSIINAVVGQLDKLIMGRLVPARELGIYEIAFEISVLPNTEIVTPARQALLGGMVDWVNDSNKFARNYIEAVAIMLSVCLPLSAGLAVVSDPLVRVLLGEKWLETAPLMKVLVFCGLVRMFTDNAWMALNVLRRPRINTMTQAFIGVFYVFFLYYGTTYYGIYGAALGQAATAVISLTINSIVLRRFLDTSLFLAFRLALRTIFATTVMVAVLLAFGPGGQRAAGLGSLPELLLTSAAGAAIFVAVHVLLWVMLGRGDGVEGRILELAVSFLRIRKWRAAP